jgi:protein arginine kinase activator
MKCDNCGKEEVNFHYTSNINGNITEKHLCADCAGKLGIDIFGNTGIGGVDGSPMQPDASFEDIFADLFGMQPNRRMLGGFGMMFPTFVIPTIGVIVPNAGVNPEAPVTDKTAAAPAASAGIKIEVDDDMKKRRELNVLREQMRQAAETEDFEKAAAIRDSIRKLENS